MSAPLAHRRVAWRDGEGRWDARLAPHVEDAAGVAVLRELADWALGNARDVGELASAGTLGVVWRKGGPARRHAALRHGAARLLGRSAPRVAEFERLAELAAEGIPAARPLAAVALHRGARLRAQALATAYEPESEPLDRRLAVARPEERARLARALGELAARLHAAGFEHRDFYLRNVLVRARASVPVLAIVDLWRGGRRTRDARGLAPARSARDVGQALLDGAALWDEEQQALVLGAYLDGRAARGSVSPSWESAAGWLRLVRAAREREARRVVADPRRWRANEPPALGWEPPALARFGREERSDDQPSAEHDRPASPSSKARRAHRR